MIDCQDMWTDRTSTRAAANMVLFTTDKRLIGIAPEWTKPGDCLCKLELYRRGVLTRDVAGSIQVISRVCCVQRAPIGQRSWAPGFSDNRPVMPAQLSVKLNLAELQVLTSPLRRPKNIIFESDVLE